MIKYENQCVGCERCIGPSCRNRRVAVVYCDECGCEITRKVHTVDDRELCSFCWDEIYEEEED